MRSWAALFCLVVVGCGGDAAEPSSEPEVERGPPLEGQSVVEHAGQIAEELLAYGSEAAAQLGLDELITDDFDGLAERRVIRVLVPYSRTYYFIERGRQHGITYEALKLFEKMVNEELGTGHIKVHVVPIPTSRDRLLPDLIEGRGDIVAAGLTITPERRTSVAFSDPFAANVREIVVTGPEEAALKLT